jgi:hypothetical protein
LYLYDGAAVTPVDAPPTRALRWAAWRAGGGAAPGCEALLVGNRGEMLWMTVARGLKPAFERRSASTVENLRGAAWSPDGSLALLCGNRGCVLLGDGERFEPLHSGVVENLRRVAWAPDGSCALIVGNGGAVLRFDPMAATLVPVPGDRAHTMRSIAWRPDGAYALIGGYASRRAGYPRPYAVYRCDGRFTQGVLATDDEDDTIAIDWQPGADPPRATILMARYEGEGGVVPGKVVQFDGSGFTYRTLRAVSAGAGDTPRRVVTLLGIGWHPGGGYALLCGEQGKLLRMQDGAMRQVPSGTQDNLVGPFWQPGVADPVALLLKGPEDRVYTV